MADEVINLEAVKEYYGYVVNLNPSCLYSPEQIEIIKERTYKVEQSKLWTPNDMLEIVLNEPDDFLKVRETLTRIGVASRRENRLYQYISYTNRVGIFCISKNSFCWTVRSLT